MSLRPPLTDEFGSWKYHRHITHSLWFGPVLGYLMGWGVVATLWKAGWPSNSVDRHHGAKPLHASLA
jgi:hypothetical protein